MPILSPADESITSKELLKQFLWKFESKSGPLTREQARKLAWDRYQTLKWQMDSSFKMPYFWMTAFLKQQYVAHA